MLNQEGKLKEKQHIMPKEVHDLQLNRNDLFNLGILFHYALRGNAEFVACNLSFNNEPGLV